MAVHLSHSLHLRADGLSAAYGGRRVFADLSFSVAAGRRIGLIGENGAGKSTLLRLLAGIEGAADAAPGALGDADVSGRLTRPVRTGFLEQVLPFRPEDRVGDVLEAAAAEVRAIERELDAAAAALAHDDDAGAASARYVAALDDAERADVWSLDTRRDELLDGLRLGAIGLDRRLDEVSGGQRSRFALAALLLAAPDALLLDEPTNHLDDDAASFLEDRLRAWRGPVLFASHDREFLDRVATGLLDLDPGRSGALALAGAGGAPAGASRDEVLAASGGTVFGGGFSQYLTVKADELERWRRQYDDEQEELRRLRGSAVDSARHVAHGRAATDNDKFLKHFKRGNVEQAVLRRVRNAEQRLETLEREQVRKPPSPLEFAGIPSGSHALEDASGLLLQLSDVVVEGRLELDALQVAPLTRLLVTGAIGAGKSTLLGVLAGDRPVDRGTVHRRRGLRVQLLEQDVRFADPDAAPRRLYERVLGERRAEQVPLSSLALIAPRDESRPIGSLSVGQQRRLALALVIARPPHVFLLDEPTNHLSLGLATDLEEALGTYPGAVVIASHDRWLRRRWAGERLELVAGRAVPVAA
ncbi:ATP-binding cassette domain-containing protein [Agromyces mariniharenae]|uniref:ABC-F family ATP-binding cassette domain-containing protein n=1 Tax=Agromyces mariniharenae TaxID=2604423 RepID=A0A5S4VF33_9MICO|nr:ATP-binding cassette domain-containing protein [Agromyces mariniharenae]TYL52645.1 ABC-F family ATP-binding cassette domain-containing protein [Agromyces mariniharenae]